MPSYEVIIRVTASEDHIFDPVDAKNTRQAEAKARKWAAEQSGFEQIDNIEVVSVVRSHVIYGS